ncbi:MAG: heme ABC exporter ATP-binding protein CcmA [Legionella sp.]
MLELINLAFDYTDKPLLRGISLAVNPGELLHIRGANGSGKTTLLRLIAGLIKPSDGVIRYQNKEIHDDLSWYQQYICYVGHKTGLSKQLTLRENLLFDLKNQHLSDNVDILFDKFDLGSLTELPYGLLSMGQQRKGALLRLCISKAKIWLLDEPFVALDSQGIETLLIFMHEHLANEGQIILSSHQSISLTSRNHQEYYL